MPKKRLLITGVSGLLGSNLAYCLKDRYEILGLFNHQPVAIAGIETRCADIRYKLHTEAIVQQFAPDIVIHAAAQADVDICEGDPKAAREVNVLGTENLLSILHDSPAKFIYISTDLVYDGVRGHFSESDPTGPRNYYAVTKLEGERVALCRPGTLVLRTNFFGWSLSKKRSLAEWVIEELRAGRPVRGFKDAIFSSIYSFDLARLIDLAIEKGLFGVYNCASRTSLSKYDFLVAVAKGAGLDTTCIQPISIDDTQLKAVRSKDLSLDVSKLARDLGVKMPTIEEGISSFIDGLGKNYRNLFVGSPIQGKYYPYLNSIPYGRQCLDDNDVEAVVQVLTTANLTQGPQIEEFERRLIELTGASFSAAVNSATSALHIACMAAGVGPLDEVVTSTNTFVASANCALYCGARPVFADIDPKTYNLSPHDLERRITEKTRVVIPVHFAGQSCDMVSIAAVVAAAQKRFGRKIFIIEDASHALGSIYNGGQIGCCAYADMAVLSFHPVKHITTGEGGALLTNDQGLHRKFCYLRSHGITSYQDELTQKDEAFESFLPGEEESLRRNPWYYEQQWLGYNYRVTDIQCALGVSQLKKLPGFIKRRREIVKMYQELLSGIPGITIPYEAPSCESNFHLFVIMIDPGIFSQPRADVMNVLRQKGVGTQVHYIPVHTQPYYQKTLGTQWGDYPVAEHYYRRCLSIPLSPAMTEEDVLYVVKALKESLGLM